MNSPNPSDIFLEEARDLLSQIEEIALTVGSGAASSEALNHLFRAFHTIKGSGAMFGFDDVANFTHHVESLLDKVREGSVALSPQLLELVLSSKDQIEALLQAAQGGPAVRSETTEKLVLALGNLTQNPLQAAPRHEGSTAGPAFQSSDPGTLQAYRIVFRPPGGLMACGTNPAMLLDELRALGECRVMADCAAIPALEKMQADQCYLAWEITLNTTRGLDAIRDVFIFVEEESELTIEAVNFTPEKEVNSPPPGDASALQQTAAEKNLSREAEGAPAPAHLTNRKFCRDSMVRVPSDRLDRLVGLVGELVMNQSRLSQIASAGGDPNLNGPVEELERLVADLRDTVLGIRMMPIGTTFNRYKRLVHDLSAGLGKEIQLVTAGGETELDKTVLDQLGDPLVHLIRNSIDHGIEPVEDRLAAGKPSHGTVSLTAAHTGSNVVVTIQDDGRGLDVNRILSKAVEKQLVALDANLTREEIYNLIFLPGFSTATQVTSVSGRGVGMDVVRRQIDVLRGSITVQSEPGRGTTILLTLPLTLAIIDGLLVEVGSTQFILPMSAVAENVDLPRETRSRNNGRNLVAVRGELIPYLRLRDDFGIIGGELETEKIVIVLQGGERIGLVVDRVLGSHQTVIQSLGRFYRGVEIVSGATIMGDGSVGLILDIAGVLRWTSRNHPVPFPQTISTATITN